MSKLPSRGPRKMHGLGKLMLQAQDLHPLKAAASPIGHALQPALCTATEAEARDAQNALEALVQRLAVAECKVQNVATVVKAFTEQCQKLPDGHGARTLVESVLTTLRDALVAAEHVSDEEMRL